MENKKKTSDKEQGNSDGGAERKEDRRDKKEWEGILGVVGHSKGLVHEQVHLSYPAIFRSVFNGCTCAEFDSGYSHYSPCRHNPVAFRIRSCHRARISNLVKTCVRELNVTAIGTYECEYCEFVKKSEILSINRNEFIDIKENLLIFRLN